MCLGWSGVSGLAKCVVADRILHGSDLHMRASTCIAFISSRVYRSMAYKLGLLAKQVAYARNTCTLSRVEECIFAAECDWN